jgi:hypothetical protein
MTAEPTSGQTAGVSAATGPTTQPNTEPNTTAPEEEGGVPDEGENATVELARIGWLATVVACLIAVLILVLQGYIGYAAVTLAVAISAAINLY